MKKLNQNEKKCLETFKNILSFLIKKSRKKVQNDDYFNGIDEIFIDKETKNPIAAIDISSYDKLKKRPPNFRKRLKQNLILGMILNG